MAGISKDILNRDIPDQSPKVDTPPFAAIVAAAALHLYQVDPVY